MRLSPKRKQNMNDTIKKYQLHPNNFLVVDNFVSKQLCDQYLDYFNNQVLTTKSENFKNQKDLLLETKTQMQKELCLFLKTPEVFCSYFSFHKLPVGARCSAHSDSLDIDGKEGSNEREFATILYLNDDFDGGELYFPDHGIEYSPRQGSLVLFSGGSGNLHGVKEVLNKDRHTLIGFWGQKK